MNFYLFLFLCEVRTILLYILYVVHSVLLMSVTNVSFG